MIARVQSLGSGGQAIALNENVCAYLVAVIVRDLDLHAHFPEIPKTFPKIFSPGPLSRLELANVPFLSMLERLVGLDPNADVYFESLAALHKARLKYERILQTQPVPTLDQIGPRGLLQYGGMKPSMLTGFLLWRKWIFDIDNRAGQETGYLFEPIIAAAIGGVPASARKSPVKRRKDGNRGRQVDCLRENRAYEIKIRMTIAASGQGVGEKNWTFLRTADRVVIYLCSSCWTRHPTRSWRNFERCFSTLAEKFMLARTPDGRTSRISLGQRWRNSWSSTFTIRFRRYLPRSRFNFPICSWRWVKGT